MPPDAADAKPPPFRGKRRVWGRPNAKRKRQLREEAELAKAQQRVAAQAEQDRRVAEARAAIEELIKQDVEDKRAAAQARRPAYVIEQCEILGLSPDTPYHPRYNLLGVSAEVDEQIVESQAFSVAHPSEAGGLGGYGHLRNFIQMTWPWVEWNPWLETCLRTLADDDYCVEMDPGSGGSDGAAQPPHGSRQRLRFVNWTGSGSAGKTFAAGVFACAYYMVDYLAGRPSPGRPLRTSVTLTSTSKGIIAQRVWPVIQRCFHECQYRDGSKMTWGHMVDSSKMVLGLGRDGSKDAKHSICAMAVESGEITKAIDKIKGRHTERMVLVVDEANSTPQAIFECIPNMLTSVRELVVLVIGNAISRLDPHGQCCEPRQGWRSISIDSDMWDTRGVAKWGIGPGVCVHFDAPKSPNVLAGRTVYKHIYSFERWQQVLRQGDEYRNTLQHWSQDRGFWPPDGIQTTVFSEAMVLSHDGTGKFSWLEAPLPCAALDPAFGGDDCVLRLGLLGRLLGGRHALQLTGRHLVPFDPDSPDAIDVQIARWVIAKCKSEGVEPHLFGLDATGIGRGVAAFINQLWSPRIQTVEFGGAASSLPASVDDPRNSHEVYANRVTELWYACRDLLVADQLKGLDAEAIKQFCTRTYVFESRRYKVEPKGDMRVRLGYSPDDADAIAVLVDVARRNGVVASPNRANRVRHLDEEAGDPVDAILNGDYSAVGSTDMYATVD